MNKAIKLFENKQIRAEWDKNQEKWYFSVVDVIAVLIDNDFQTARKYWNKLSQRIREEAEEAVTKCHQLKLEVEGGNLNCPQFGYT